MPTYKILSFDPGMSTFGFCVSTYDECRFVIRTAKTYNLDEAYKKCSPDKKGKYNINCIKSHILYRFVSDLLVKYRPNFIASEAAFYNPGRPSAYASLLRFIYTLDDIVYRGYGKNVYKMAPLIIKKVASSNVGGKATKEDMREALNNRISKGYIKSSFDIGILDEHAIDASLVGYAFAKLWIPIITASLLSPKITTYTRSVEIDIRNIYEKMEQKRAHCNVTKPRRKKKSNKM